MNIANTHFQDMFFTRLCTDLKNQNQHYDPSSDPGHISSDWWTHPDIFSFNQTTSSLPLDVVLSKQIRRRQTNMWKSVRTSHQRSVDGSDPDVAVWQVFETRV